MPGRKYNEGDIIITTCGVVARILWIGRVKSLANRNKLYGIEYIDTTIGVFDGLYGGKRYFHGRKDKCSLVKYSELRGHWSFANYKDCGTIIIDGSSDVNKDPIQRFIIGKGNLPYSLAESPYWKEFILHLCPGMQFPNVK